jgi:hypothetical protein
MGGILEEGGLGFLLLHHHFPPPLPELGKGLQGKGEDELKGLTPVQFWHRVLDGKCSTAAAGKALTEARGVVRCKKVSASTKKSV